jgi:hypothetical protein
VLLVPAFVLPLYSCLNFLSAPLIYCIVFAISEKKSNKCEKNKTQKKKKERELQGCKSLCFESVIKSFMFLYKIYGASNNNIYFFVDGLFHFISVP